MKDLIWDEALSVQVQEIDDDHRRLVDLFNMLNHSVTDNEAPDYINALLEELITCTAWHFRHEERLMVKYGYQGLDEHRAEHNELIASARAIQQQGQPVSFQDIEFLEHWLTGHILGADMELGSYLGEEM